MHNKYAVNYNVQSPEKMRFFDLASDNSILILYKIVVEIFGIYIIII